MGDFKRWLQSGTYIVTKDVVGTRYCMLLVRVQFNIKCAKVSDLATMLQNRIKVEQQSSIEMYRPLPWDLSGFMAMKKYYQNLDKLNESVTDFGKRTGDVDVHRQCQHWDGAV